jgi:cyclophilin family peptidyl-prolyl cis-trans isomerase/HEAT repeat protein
VSSARGVLAVGLIAAALSGPTHARDAVRTGPSQWDDSTQEEKRQAILAIEDARAPVWDDVRTLLALARVNMSDTPQLALRALGRLERTDLINEILPFLSRGQERGEAANALVQSFRGRSLEKNGSRLEQMALDALRAAGGREFAKTTPTLGDIARSIGRLPYATPAQVKSAEGFLRQVLEKTVCPSPPRPDSAHEGAARGLESLARLSRRVATLEEETIGVLRALAGRTFKTEHADVRRNAMAALIAAQGVDADTLKKVLDDEDQEVRRLAVVALTGSGSAIADQERVDLIREYLSDRSAMVRYEAVRAWVRRGAPAHGCQPLLGALSDDSDHVVLSAIDALGDLCQADGDITDRVTAEARTPPNIGSWHREAHAFVALAKRAPDRAAISMSSFAMHDDPFVRMYAGRAAAVLNDATTLTRLAADPNDNVAEIALPALRRRLGADSDAAFVAALNRETRIVPGRAAKIRPYSVIRTAAIQLKGAQPTTDLATALANALTRISEEQCETSRDVRLALIERLGELGSVAQQSTLLPLLKDIDPEVGKAAATLLLRWTGKAHVVQPPARVPTRIPTIAELASEPCVSIAMESGKQFRITRLPTYAPMAWQRFTTLAKAGYYNELTFHRVVPNFVIQGGSPGANEYCGDCAFMRDEVGLVRHTRGTVGISTRGRDTGDAQLFINLVDNPRLDHEYTVFGVVTGMEVVDTILEGDRMMRVTVLGMRSCK